MRSWRAMTFANQELLLEILLQHQCQQNHQHHCTCWSCYWRFPNSPAEILNKMIPFLSLIHPISGAVNFPFLKPFSITNFHKKIFPYQKCTLRLKQSCQMKTLQRKMRHLVKLGLPTSNVETSGHLRECKERVISVSEAKNVAQ